MGGYAVILTYSTSHAAKVEKLLREARMEAKMVPTPRHLSSDCGLAVRICEVDRKAAEIVLREKGPPFDRIESI